MYIHNYQIHNVLNAYRKQLSQTPDKASVKRPSQEPHGQMETPSEKAQPAIVNQISTEIIDRIARFGPQSDFDSAVTDKMAEMSTSQHDAEERTGIDFTYTLIDDQNRKQTQTLPMDALNVLKYKVRQQDVSSSNAAKEQSPEKALPNNNQERQSVWKG